MDIRWPRPLCSLEGRWVRQPWQRCRSPFPLDTDGGRTSAPSGSAAHRGHARKLRSRASLSSTSRGAGRGDTFSFLRNLICFSADTASRQGMTEVARSCWREGTEGTRTVARDATSSLRLAAQRRWWTGYRNLSGACQPGGRRYRCLQGFTRSSVLPASSSRSWPWWLRSEGPHMPPAVASAASRRKKSKRSPRSMRASRGRLVLQDRQVPRATMGRRVPRGTPGRRVRPGRRVLRARRAKMGPTAKMVHLGPLEEPFPGKPPRRELGLSVLLLKGTTFR
jgi:hypothetical protein